MNKMQKQIFLLTLLLLTSSALFLNSANQFYQQRMALNQKEVELKLVYHSLEGSKHDLTALLDTSKEYLYSIDTITRYSEEYGVSPTIIIAVMKMESGFDANASSGTSYGLMQINNAHLKDFENKMEILQIDKNIECGVSLLSGLQKQNKDLHYILNSYNMGQYGYKEFIAKTGQTSRHYSREGIKIINQLKE